MIFRASLNDSHVSFESAAITLPKPSNFIMEIYLVLRSLIDMRMIVLIGLVCNCGV